MTERAYTLREIDRMRELIKLRLSPRNRDADGRVYIVGDTFHSDGRVTPAVDPAIVEDRLRTYMMAGITVEELEAEPEA